MVRDNRHDSAHLFGAICPERGVGAAIIMPAVNTEAMNEHLKEISAQIARGAHALLICDGAGWHQPGERLIVPDNITLLHLPPYAPELNPVEYLWAYWKQHELPNVCPQDYWQLSETARRTLRRMRRCPRLITAFWQQASLWPE
jgi:transposase